MSDFHGRIAEALVRRRERAFAMFYKILTIAHSYYWGINIGRNCSFYGMPIFHRAMGSKIIIGDNCTFRSAKWSNFVGLNRGCMFSTLYSDALIKIGSNSGFSGTVIGAAERVVIGDNVMCGGNVTITDTDWHGIEADRRTERGKSCPVIIEDNVWLGLNVVVLKGVTIGKNSVVAAGSIVSKSIPSNVIAGGQPAKVIKNL